MTTGLKDLHSDVYNSFKESDAGKNVVNYIEFLSHNKTVLALGYSEFLVMFPQNAVQLLSMPNVITDSAQLSPEQIQNIQKGYILVYLTYAIGTRQNRFHNPMLEQSASGIHHPLHLTAGEYFRLHTRRIIIENKHIQEPKISYVILTGLSNTASFAETIESFVKFTRAEKYKEVVVVLNESEHEAGILAAEKLRNFNYKLVYLNPNRHATGGYNAGIDNSKGKYITFLQDDIIFTQKDWDEELAYYLDKYQDIGVIGGFRGTYYFRTNDIKDDSLINPVIPIGSDMTGNCNWQLAKEKLVETDTVSSMCMMFRREIGSIEWQFLPAGFDDISLCFKARETGYNIYLTDVGILHATTSLKRTRKSRTLTEEVEHNLSSLLPRTLTYAEFRHKYGHLLRTESFKIINNIRTVQEMESFVNTLPKDFPGIIIAE